MSQLYGAADLFLLPSLEENLPNTLLEAMSCGTPAIAFASGGVPEVIVQDETGKLIPIENHAEFAMAIEELASDENLRMRIAENCRQTIVERFTQQAQAERYLELYRELMRGLPRTASKYDAFGFGPGNDFKVTKLAPIGARLQQICADSLPKPLLKCLIEMEKQIAANDSELHTLKNFLEIQQHTIEELQTELADQKGALRERETTIFRQNQILGSSRVKMLRALKLISK
jgi:hypothetical protein